MTKTITSIGSYSLKRCAASVLALSISVACSAMATAGENKRLQFDVDSQPLKLALFSVARQAGIIITVSDEIGESILAPRINGSMTTDEAVEQLLAGTGLEYRYMGDDAIVVNWVNGDAPESGGKKVPMSDKQHEMEEMIVTATKRETSLQDTAMAISALGSDTIEKRGLTQMGDYMSTLPGVTMQDRGGTGNSIVIRGISVQPESSNDEAVGVYFGETPVSGGLTNGVGSFDLKMVDIERVEVLRGPQGTLFGSGSMGGTVRVLPAEPKLDSIEGKVVAQYSQTGINGGGNNMMQGVFNLPLIENTLAIRGVAYRFDDSGYVDNIAASYDGDWRSVNSVNTRETFGETAAAWGAVVRDMDDRGAKTTTGARLSALWQPTENLSASLGYTWQKTDANGWPDVDTSLPGKYQQLRVAPSLNSNLLDGPDMFEGGPPIAAEYFYNRLDVITLSLDYDLGWGNLHSSSSWLSRDAEESRDWTKELPHLAVYFTFADRTSDRFFQEIRFSSNFDGPLQMLLGGYYEDIDNNNIYGEAFGGDPNQVSNFFTTANVNGYVVPDAVADWPEMYWINKPWDDALKQKAFFGEVSWDFYENLTATIGVRHYEYEQENDQAYFGFWIGTLDPIANAFQGENKGETYKANLSWKPSEDTLVYFQWAEGFRPGQALPWLNPNLYDPEGTGFYTTVDGDKIPILPQTDPDTLENFELGFKGAFVDGRISIGASLYRINWVGLPVSVRVVYIDNPGFGQGRLVNAGESTSEGVELEGRFLLSDNLRLDLSASYNEAKLAKDQAGLGKKGDDLPGSADLNFSAGLEYGFEMYGYDAFVRADYSYVDAYDTYLNQSPNTPSSGGYSQIHMKSGVSINNVDVSLFVRNLTNADEFTWVSNGWVFGSAEGFRLRPRTIGMNVSYHF